MDAAQEQQRKKGGRPDAEVAHQAPTNVFDQLGNEGLKGKVAEVAAEAPVEEETSLLALAEEAEVQAPEQEEAEERVVAGGQDEERVIQSAKAAKLSPEEAEVVAARQGVDPTLVVDPRKVGDSREARELALGAEGRRLIEEEMARTTAELGAVALDAAAVQLVVDKVEQETTAGEVVEARQSGKLDEVIRTALRNSAVRSRDEVVFLLQQLMGNNGQIRRMLEKGGEATAALELIEHLAVELVEPADLYALAAYDHSDIRAKVLVDDEALNIAPQLTPYARRMGGFASVLYQMLQNEFVAHPLPDPMLYGVTGDEKDPALEAARVDTFRANLFNLTNQIRLFRSTSA